MSESPGSRDCTPRSSRFEMDSRLLADVGVGFDLEQHVGVDQSSDFHHCRSRPDVAEEFSMRSPDLLPIRDVPHKRACAHHVLHACACLLKRRLDIPERLYRLGVRITHTHDLSIRTGRRRSSYMHKRSDPNGSRVTDYRLPWSTTGDIRALHNRRFFLRCRSFYWQLIEHRGVALSSRAQ